MPTSTNDPRTPPPQPTEAAEGPGTDVRRTAPVQDAGGRTTGGWLYLGGPGSWWRIGLVALVVIAALILLGRLVTGDSAGPNTPDAEQTQPAGQPVDR